MAAGSTLKRLRARLSVPSDARLPILCAALVWRLAFRWWILLIYTSRYLCLGTKLSYAMLSYAMRLDFFGSYL